jgi:cytoskeletal protein RodZ
METVGKYLKRERELRNISLKEISTATKIRESLLRAIEEDRYDLLPSSVFVKGFLIAYGKYIGLDPSDVALRYESDLKELHEYEEKRPLLPRRKEWNRGFLLGTIVLIVGITILILNLWREPKEQGEHAPAHLEETPLVQEESPTPPVVPKEEDIARPVEETISVEEAPPAETPVAERLSTQGEIGGGNLTLQIKAVEDTWIAFQVDSDFPREITLRAGETFSQRADDQIKLKIGNAGGVNVIFNGEPIGPLGGAGKIVRLSLTEKGYEFKKRDDFEIPRYGDEAEPSTSD